MQVIKVGQNTIQKGDFVRADSFGELCKENYQKHTSKSEQGELALPAEKTKNCIKDLHKEIQHGPTLESM